MMGKVSQIRKIASPKNFFSTLADDNRLGQVLSPKARQSDNSRKNLMRQLCELEQQVQARLQARNDEIEQQR